MKENQRLAQEALEDPTLQEQLRQWNLDEKSLRLDYFLDPSFLVFQHGQHFCFNADSAALAQFIHIRPGQRVLEIGTNNGAILAYLARYVPGFLCGVEILEQPAKLAALNMTRLVPSAVPWQIVQGSIQTFQKSPASLFQQAEDSEQRLKPIEPPTIVSQNQKSEKEVQAPFDVVFCNPPYFALESSRHHETLSLRQLARFEQNLDLVVMIQEAARLLRSHGRFFFVHRPNRLAQSFVTLEENGFSVARLQIVYDKRDNEAKAFLIEAIKEGTCEPKILPPLFRS